MLDMLELDSLWLDELADMLDSLLSDELLDDQLRLDALLELMLLLLLSD